MSSYMRLRCCSIFFCKQKTAYEMRISDWSSDVCSSDLLSHVDPDAFEIGVNIATTPGKVIHETDLYQLIHYAPTTKEVFTVPLVIFPPWINRFYIIDLNPAKSFVKWAVEQSVSVFMVSLKSADASMKDIVWADYVAAQIDANDTILDLLAVPPVPAIGFCVAATPDRKSLV